MRSRCGRATIDAAGGRRGVVERMHRRFRLCSKSEVRAIGNGCRKTVNRDFHPEVRIKLSIRNRTRMFDDPPAIQCREYLVVERNGTIEIVGPIDRRETCRDFRLPCRYLALIEPSPILRLPS